MEKSLFEKMKKRIKREFKKVKYIGDIHISDEEYEVLKEYIPIVFRRLRMTSSHECVDEIFAVALVQIGIRNYNGRYWTYVSKLIDGGINNVQQGWIGRSFVKTLDKYNKIHVGAEEMVNNILMHSFITKYYAADFFDFIFAYYQKDLDRDLSRHTKEMRNYLISSMKMSEDSVRSYKIKRHTADAVTANEIGCKIRIRRILQLMDNYMFSGVLPTNSQNRVTNLFVEWAKTSKAFDVARKEYSTGKKGQKRFSSPYLRFDTAYKDFVLVLPPQNVRLNEDEAWAKIEWKIECSGEFNVIETESEGTVIGCKTHSVSQSIPLNKIFDEFSISLIKNDDDVLRRFVLKNDTVRFFDKDWDMINSADYLPVGEVLAFSKSEVEIISDSTVGVEQALGMNLYTLNLKKGDVVKYPDGRAKSVGRELEEGLLQQHLVASASVSGTEKVPLYSSCPLIYFVMEESRETGTVIHIDGEKHRLNLNFCTKFKLNISGNKYGYILKTDNYNLCEGNHNVCIDIPNDRKNRIYNFAFISGLNFVFCGAPYIFKEQGKILFSDNVCVAPISDFVWEAEEGYEFDILPDENYIEFEIKTARETFNVNIDIPVLKWKFDDWEWEVSQPEAIWYTEFPKKIFIKYPADDARFFMDAPEVVDISYEDAEDNYETHFARNKQEDLFICDTTKMPSWFGRYDPVRKLYLELDGKIIVFAAVITKCILNSCKIVGDYERNELILKADISGFADCFVDLLYRGNLIVEKLPVTMGGVRLNVPMVDGIYTAVFYEQDEEEDDFGFGFEDACVEFSKYDCHYKNPYDLTHKTLIVNKIIKLNAADSIFSHSSFNTSKKYYITVQSRDRNDPLCYYGKLTSPASNINDYVQIRTLNHKNPEKITVKLCRSYSDDNAVVENYMFDTKQGVLIPTNTLGWESKLYAANKNIIELSSEEYYFAVSCR